MSAGSRKAIPAWIGPVGACLHAMVGGRIATKVAPTKPSQVAWWNAPRILALAAALFAGGALPARDYEFNVNMVTGADAEIKLTVPGGQMPQSGFLPLRVRINNRNTSERSWRMELGSTPMGGYGGAGSDLSSVRSFDVPGASTREFFIFAPVLAVAHRRGVGLQVNLDGPEVERSEFGLGLGYSWGAANAPLAVEPALEEPMNRALLAHAGPGGSAGPRHGRPSGAPMQSISVIDPALWPADWRLWSAFATVLLDHATWERLDASRRRALLDWVALGGRLMRVNSPAAGRESIGAGEVITRVGPVFSTPNDLKELQNPDTTRLLDPSGPLASTHFWDLAPRTWQLPGRHRWLTGYIIVFGLLIGPVNLFYFAPAGRRHRLFFTVPVLSLTAALLLFGIITFSDGFGGAGTRRAVVVLQPAQNQAVVFQRQISRTGMLAGRSFPLPVDVIMNLQSEERQSMGLSQELWREEDKASGDWFTSRSMQQHTLRRLVPTRERVELVSAPGAAPVVQSTVSGMLRDFLFMDPTGAVWTAAEVPPGARVTLVASSDYQAAGRQRFLHFPKLAHGSFYAVGGAGGLIPTLASIRWRDDLVLYTGRLHAAQEAAP
jgi:hypothetical protein